MFKEDQKNEIFSTTRPTKQSDSEKSYIQSLSVSHKFFIFLLILMLFGSTFYVYDEEKLKQKLTVNNQHVEIKAADNAGLANDTTQAKTVKVKSCNDLCEKRETIRKDKFGGDLLDPKEILRLAKQGRDKTIAALKEDYGEYFESMFVEKSAEENNGSPKYWGMSCIKSQDQQRCESRDRLKRKLKIKVLRMMHALKTSESNVVGCNCLEKNGKPNGKADEYVYETPDFYEKYVFANGGHSQAAGHGNKFNESYTAYLGRDLRPVWEAIGIEMIDRNYAMGAMKASPYIASCSKETFGIDVDFLTWNYGMTDKNMNSVFYYFYRGITNPGRPAFMVIDGDRSARNLCTEVDKGASAFFLPQKISEVEMSIPDSAPDGIPRNDTFIQKLPPYVRAFRCGNSLEGGKPCGGEKWSCTPAIRASTGCQCPNVGKRDGWHMGYKRHALTGHLIALPLIEILMEGLEQLADSEEDPESLLVQLEEEDNVLMEEFLSKPVPSGVGDFFQMDEELVNIWFKGPSICRTSMVPAESRYLGIATESDKVGGPAVFSHETYDVGLQIDRDQGVYSYPNGFQPTPGEFYIIAPKGSRSGAGNITDWEAECNSVVMADYKDWFFSIPNADNKAFLTFPNEREKSYYGYEPSKFKGIIGIIPCMFTEKHCKCTPTDIPLKKVMHEHVNMTVNGKPVGRYRDFVSMLILEDESGSINWEPSEKQNYALEFQVFGEIDEKPASEYHLRFYSVVLY